MLCITCNNLHLRVLRQLFYLEKLTENLTSHTLSNPHLHHTPRKPRLDSIRGGSGSGCLWIHLPNGSDFIPNLPPATRERLPCRGYQARAVPRCPVGVPVPALPRQRALRTDAVPAARPGSGSCPDVPPALPVRRFPRGQFPGDLGVGGFGRPAPRFARSCLAVPEPGSPGRPERIRLPLLASAPADRMDSLPLPSRSPPSLAGAFCA